MGVERLNEDEYYLYEMKERRKLKSESYDKPAKVKCNEEEE